MMDNDLPTVSRPKPSFWKMRPPVPEPDADQGSFSLLSSSVIVSLQGPTYLLQRLPERRGSPTVQPNQATSKHCDTRREQRLNDVEH